MFHQSKEAVKIGLTIIGTIVGAGFASGKEIQLFFSQFGIWGTGGILLSSCLLGWFSILTMAFAKAHNIRSPQHFYAYIFGLRFRSITTLFMILSLFAVSCVMLAGAGRALQNIFPINYWFASILSTMLLLLIMLQALRGLYAVNTIVVPVMLVFILSLFFALYSQHPIWRQTPVISVEHAWHALLKAVLYVTFNITMAMTVLLSIGASQQSKRSIIIGGWLGATGICILLLCCNYILQNVPLAITLSEMPIGLFAMRTMNGLGVLYFILVYFEILSTLTANALGMSLHFTRFKRISRQLLFSFLIILCLLIGQLGFARLLDLLYPLVGVMGCYWLLRLIQLSYFKKQK